MAQLQQFDLVAPGRYGLNTESSNVLMPPQFATKASNMVINRSGRLAARKGYSDVTTNAISGGATQIDVIFEFLTKAGVSEMICTGGNKIYKDVDDFTDANNDITSTTAPTADHWQFVNFNGKVLGFQRGHTPIERSSGDFTDASYTGTGPDGNAAVAAFGRVWAADADLQTVRYSVLLDDTDYSTGNGGGTLDMSSIWSQGMDEIVALASIGSNLVVFGRNHIVLWADGSGSEIGLDPTQMQVVDIVEGTGCIARDSVQATGEGDLIFLSRHGVQSLGRVIEFKSNPLVTLSKLVRQDMAASISSQRSADADFDQVRSTYYAQDGLYIINFPQVDKQYVFDMQHPYQDPASGETMFPVTTWTLGGTVVGMCTTIDQTLYFGLANGQVGSYGNYSDAGSGYLVQFDSGWLDFGEQLNHRLKILKEMIVSVVTGNVDVTYTWEFDFNGTTLSRVLSYTGASFAEWGTAKFNEDEYAGGASVQRKRLPGHGEGQFLRVGASATVSGIELAIQHITISPKIGRMAS